MLIYTITALNKLKFYVQPHSSQLMSKLFLERILWMVLHSEKKIDINIRRMSGADKAYIWLTKINLYPLFNYFSIVLYKTEGNGRGHREL